MTVRHLPLILLGGYLLLFAALAVAPYDRAVWWAENIPIMLIVLLLIITYPLYRFSSLSYLLMAVLIVLHTIGGHFTFERVPFEWVNGFFGFERNMYDRMAHFSVGLYAYAFAEVLLRKRLVRSQLILFTFPVFAIFSVASLYEIFEWWYAISADPAAGIAVLGSQGDIWDAQKDMLSDGLGSILAVMLFGWLHRGEIGKIGEDGVPDKRV